eukprot:Gb_09663 [translate_table: standard]
MLVRAETVLTFVHLSRMECREFRESILGVMPHRWERREDTRFELAHFRKHKRKHLKKMPGKRTLSPFHKPEESHVFGKDSTNKIASVIGKAAEYAASAKSKKILSKIGTCPVLPLFIPCMIETLTCKMYSNYHLSGYIF